MRHLLISTLIISSAPAGAAVVETRPSGFTIQHEAVVPVKPEVIYKRFGQPKLWWNPEHSWWGKAENLSMKLKPGGCYCEKTPDGSGQAEHLRVVFVEKNKMVRLTGALGPLSMQAASGAMTVTFKAEGEGTRVTMRYDAEGHFEPPADKLAPLVDMVLGEQFGRLTSLK